MANSLTGDFEAVVQIGVGQINGILAKLHERGGDGDARLAFPHSITLRLGDSDRRFPDADIGNWVAEYHRAHGGGSGRGRERGPEATVVERVPPGLAERLREALSDFDLPVGPTAAGAVRGAARVQVSSPRISLAAGATSEVTVHNRVRAEYTPDPGTADLPAPIHGEIRAAFESRAVQSGEHGRRLVITPSSQDSKIVFEPAAGSGLTAADAGRISAEVRRVLRDGIGALPVDLSPDFAFGDFKGVGTGSGQALALPLRLSGPGLPTGNIHSVGDSFIGAAGFAVAISREFVTSVFQPTIDELLQLSRDVEVDTPGPNSTYRFSVTSVELGFNDTTIELVIRARAVHWFWPNFNDIVIRQKFALLMAFDALFVRASDYEPQVSGLSIAGYSLPTSAIRSAIVAERERALPATEAALNARLRNARDRLDHALREFDPSFSARFRAGSSVDATSSTTGGVDIRADGIIIRGDIRASDPSPAPRVGIEDVRPGAAYSAFPSWVPGGWIERLSWSWVTRHPFTAYGAQVSAHADEHRFGLSIPAPPPGPLGPELAQVCLRVEGQRTRMDGSVEVVAAGSACHIAEPEVFLDAPSWWEPVTVPLWSAGRTNGGGRARDAIAAHVSVQAGAAGDRRLGRNTLVYFADWNDEAPAAILGDALALVKRTRFALGVVVVLPAGTFDRSRDEIERRIARARSRISAPLLLTEDDEGGWTRSFAPARLPSVFLVNARREFVWKSDGDPEPAALAAALDALMVPAPLSPARPLRLSVSVGEPVPEIMVEGGDDPFALHRLRGRRVSLTFWQSWSEPCLTELRRIQDQLDERGQPARGGRGADDPFVVGIHGGTDPAAIEAIRKKLGLGFVLVHDARQRIARRYGVRCWPTTVTVDERGAVEYVRFGLSSGDANEARETVPEPPMPAPAAR